MFFDGAKIETLRKMRKESRTNEGKIMDKLDEKMDF